MRQPANFVLCPNYHGATLFGLLANNHEQITSLGDTVPIRAHLNHGCSCHKLIQDCEFWQAVAREMKTDRFKNDRKLLPGAPRLLPDHRDNERLAKWIIRRIQNHRFSLWQLTPWATSQFRTVMEKYPEVVCRLQGTRVFVDGAKELHRTMAYLLIVKPRRARVIHIVRDPRGFVVSCDVNLANRGMSHEQSTQVWNKYHAYIMERVATFPGVEYLRVRYEDLCADPRATMERAFRFLDVEPQDVVVAPRQPHHIIGNRMMLEFDGTVTLDTRWRERLSAVQQQAILEKTAPLAGRFGYAAK